MAKVEIDPRQRLEGATGGEIGKLPARLAEDVARKAAEAARKLEALEFEQKKAVTGSGFSAEEGGPTTGTVASTS